MSDESITLHSLFAGLQSAQARQAAPENRRTAAPKRRSIAVGGGGHDLGQLIASLGGGQDGRGAGVKGSRFSRIEKLQFAPVGWRVYLEHFVW